MPHIPIPMRHKFILGLLAIAGLIFTASAQEKPLIFGAFSGVPATMPASSTSNVLDAVSVQGCRGMAIQPVFVGSNGITANVIFTFSYSIDGTNYTTTTTTKTNAINSVTAVRGLHLFSEAELAGVRLLRLNSIQNAGAAPLTNTGVYYSIRN